MTINNAQKIIAAAALADDTVIIEGLHGCGKSAIVKQYAKDAGFHCEELFLSMLEPGDLLGMPRTVTTNSTTVTTWAEPVWFRRIKDAAWPVELDFDALSFEDKDFENYVKEHLSIS